MDTVETKKIFRPYWANADFSELMGKTLVKIEGLKDSGDEVVFTTADGEEYRMYHEQDCCESVNIESVVGEVDDLIGSPITMADEATNIDDPSPSPNEWADSYTWTFYKLATVKGYVTIRWYGESNGYYSESVYFRKLVKGEK